LGYGHGAGLFTLSADRENSGVKIEVLYPQFNTFIDAKPAAVLELGDKMAIGVAFIPNTFSFRPFTGPL
jgi:hypothetical protein